MQIQKKFFLKNKIKIAIIFVIVATSLICLANLFFTKKSNTVIAEINDPVLPSAYCIRDEYYLQTANQYNQGLCWAFASSTAFTTTVMKSTNQYIDYSEAWASIDRACKLENYLPGDGGSFFWFTDTIKTSGIIQEQDLNYEESYQATKENIEHYYDYYSQFADNSIVKNYYAVNYRIDKDADYETKQDFIMQAKHHILQSGGLYVEFTAAFSSTFVNNHLVHYRVPNPQNARSAHAVCVIGWDDEIEVQFENDITYKGAWIFINSYGYKSGNDGIYYLFYDDPSAYNFHGYKYAEEHDNLYFFNELTDSNAYFITEYKNAYTGSFESTTAETKQRNVFYNTKTPTLTYSYELSPNSNIDNVEVFYKQTDVSNKFNFLYNNNSITINAKEELELGIYKIVWTYSNSTETESVCGAFYLLDGTEIAELRFYAQGENTINKSNQLQINDMYHHGYDYITYASTEYELFLQIHVHPVMYSLLKQVFIKNSANNETLVSSPVFTSDYNYFVLNYTYNLTEQTVYDICITYTNGTERIFKLYFDMVNPETESYVRVNYSLNGGTNHISNKKAFIISNTESKPIENPTKEGYGFAGWYYSKDFKASSLLKCHNDKYFLEYDKIIHYNTFSTYWTKNDSQEYAKNNFKSFIIYAKWVKLELNKTYHTITGIIKGNGYISEQGVIFVEHGLTKHFEINSEGYQITSAIVDNLPLDSNQINNLAENGLTFENVSENHSFTFVFVPRSDTIYKVNYYLQSLTETSNFFNNKYYTFESSRTKTGTTDEMTNEIAENLFPNYFALEFEQQIIKPDGSTTINIFFDRNIYNIQVIFNGIRNSSTEYDIDENVLFGESKTYTIKLIGYVINECRLDGDIVQANQTISLNDINQNHLIEIDVEEKLHKITCETVQNGRIICHGSLKKIGDGDTRHFTVVADDEYVLKEVTVNGEKIEVTDGKFSLVVDQDFYINATFNPKKQPLISINTIIICEIVLISAILLIVFVKIIIDKNKYEKTLQ